MKSAWIGVATLGVLFHLPQIAFSQTKRGVAQAPPPAQVLPQGAATGSVPPPPPGPPPNFIDDDTEFDDGDDLPEDYGPPQPMPGRAGQMPQAQQVPYPPPQQGAVRPMPPSPPPAPPPARVSSYEDDRPRLNGGKIHFKVVHGEFAIPGEIRQRGKMDN